MYFTRNTPGIEEGTTNSPVADKVNGAESLK